MASRFPVTLIGPPTLSFRTVLVPIAAGFFVLLVAVSGCIREDDLSLDQRAYQLAGELMCPVCDGQTIDGSNAQIAKDMRAKVRELLNEGKTNAEVKEYFVIRYGQEILAAPEGRGFNLLVWIVPVVIVASGIGIALFTIKNMRKSGLESQAADTPAPTTQHPGDDLYDYLARVDRDLGDSSTSSNDAADDDTPAADQSDEVSR